MKIMNAVLFAAVSTIAVATTPTALAEKCSGFSSSKGEPPVNIVKKADGSQVMFMLQQRIHNVTEPPNDPGNGAHGTNTALWTVGPDGQSGSGAGTVYYVDKDGDTWAVSWEGNDAGGTWKRAWGTGKYEGSTGSGTWSPAVVYQDGMSWHAWEGECSSATG